MKFTPNLVVGVVITLVGCVLMLDRLGMVQFGEALRLWPVLLTLFGISVVVQSLRSDTEGSSGGTRPIVGPGLVLFLVVVGLFAWRTEGRTFVRSGDPADPRVSLVGIMGRDDRVSLSQAFNGAEMTTVMGRTRLDLRKATLATNGEVSVDVFGMMGAVEIVVPSHWIVDTQAWAVMGGIDDRRRKPLATTDASSSKEDAKTSDARASSSGPSTGEPPAALPATDTAPRLVVRGMVLMGALVIRS